MKIQVCTTFSHDGYRIYGKRFIESFLAHDRDSELVAYHEHAQPDLKHPRLYWRSLEEDQDRANFLEANGSDPKKIGTPADFNGQSIRFCHKVFAITNAIARNDGDWTVWIDADVTVHAAPKWPDLLKGDVCYLGRDPSQDKNWIINGVKRPICSETGFVGYRNTPEVRKMSDDMRMMYMTGEIYTRPATDWHDAKVFDVCRERSTIPKDKQVNLTQGILGTHVWPKLPALASWCQHNKGPGRKVQAYGGHCD